MITTPLTLLNWGTSSHYALLSNLVEEDGPALNPKTERQSDIADTSGLVIVVDDNKDAADSLGELFRILGYETLIAYNGTDGLALFCNTQPRFVFLDIAMPDMSGHEVVRHMRKDGAKDTVFVAVTGFGQEEDKARSHEAGFDYHLTKPINLSEMREILSNHS